MFKSDFLNLHSFIRRPVVVHHVVQHLVGNALGFHHGQQPVFFINSVTHYIDFRHIGELVQRLVGGIDILLRAGHLFKGNILSHFEANLCVVYLGQLLSGDIQNIVHLLLVVDVSQNSSIIRILIGCFVVKNKEHKTNDDDGAEECGKHSGGVVLIAVPGIIHLINQAVLHGSEKTIHGSLNSVMGGNHIRCFIYDDFSQGDFSFFRRFLCCLFLSLLRSLCLCFRRFLRFRFRLFSGSRFFLRVLFVSLFFF